MVNVFPVPNGPSKSTGGEEVLIDNVIAVTACFCSWLSGESRNRLERIARLPASTCRKSRIISLLVLQCSSIRNTKSISSRLSTAKCHSQKLRRLKTNCTSISSSLCASKSQQVTHSLLSLTYTECELLSSMWASKISYLVFLCHNLSRTLLQLRCRSLPLCVSSKMSRLRGICDGNKFHTLDENGWERESERNDASIFDFNWGVNTIERELNEFNRRYTRNIQKTI